MALSFNSIIKRYLCFIIGNVFFSKSRKQNQRKWAVTGSVIRLVAPEIWISSIYLVDSDIWISSDRSWIMNFHIYTHPYRYFLKSFIVKIHKTFLTYFLAMVKFPQKESKTIKLNNQSNKNCRSYRRVRGERRQLSWELRNQTTRRSAKKPDNSAER